MDIYTMDTWKHDRDFNADPGQEITEEVYNEMLNTMPPGTLPQEKARQALEDYKIPVHAGFLMGEPHTTGDNGQFLYHAFGMNDYGKGGHYYYLGLSEAVKGIPDGEYYFMDCMNAFVNNGLFPAAEFKDDADAIQTAADYEATLYKYEYRNGERISSKTLYEPAFI